MKISVVVTTYNRPQALCLVLRALLSQDQPPFEIVVADDGSGDTTRQAIRQMASGADIPIRHLWQTDVGFRAASARNMAVAAAQGELIVFLDGDCIPRPDFIAQHARLAQVGWFVAGSRLLLAPALTQKAEDQSMVAIAQPARARLAAQTARALAKRSHLQHGCVAQRLGGGEWL